MTTARNALSQLALAAFLLLSVPAHAVSIQIDIDTTSLGVDGHNWDLAFDLIDGNLQPNAVTISGFVINGGALTGAAGYPKVMGNVAGNLAIAPGIVTLDDNFPVPGSFFDEYLDNAVLGTSIRFLLQFIGNQDTLPFPDSFAFFLLDPDTGQPLPTADPTGALFVYSLGNADQPALYCRQDTDCVTATPVEEAVDVPEPDALALAMAALIALGIVRATREFRKSQCCEA